MVFTNSLLLKEAVWLLLPGLISGIPSILLGIASYVLTAMSLYSMAVRRQIGGAWISWVPKLNSWVMGSLSDQYRYVVKGQYRSKRKSLLILNSLSLVLGTVVLMLVFSVASDLMRGAAYGAFFRILEDTMLGPVLMLCVLVLALIGINIGAMVIRYMALYDIYTSMDPGNNVMFLVLSIFFRVTEPFFLFFNRNRDKGMPPRRETPIHEEPKREAAEPLSEKIEQV